MPTAITDSPIATMTTSPCRSTKWPGAITKPRSPTSRGVTCCSTSASAQSTYCAVPPAMPPARISSAEEPFSGAIRRIARGRALVRRAREQPGVDGGDREVRETERDPVALERAGDRERHDEEPGHAAEQQQAPVRAGGPRTALVSQA